MRRDVSTFARWLEQARVAEHCLSPSQRELLQAVCQFRQRCGQDYYSTRLLSHFLLHCGSGLKVAAIARLLGISRSAASAQQDVTSKEVVQAAQHRLSGRAHGKLLPRFAGPIAQFLHEQPKASRGDLLDFIQRTWAVSVSRMALHRFLKKYGLDRVSLRGVEETCLSAVAGGVPEDRSSSARDRAAGSALVVATAVAAPAPGTPVAVPPREFFLPPPTTPAPSSCCPMPSTGWRPRKSASTIPTVPCGADC